MSQSLSGLLGFQQGGKQIESLQEKKGLHVSRRDDLISRDLKALAGLIIGMVGLFISFAAFQIFPQGSNAISEWGEGSKYMGCVVTSLGFLLSLAQLKR